MRAIVVRGGWEGHVPVEATDRFVPFLREHGYDVHTTEDLDVYADRGHMGDVDLVVQCWSMGEITAEQREGLDSAVRAGTGLAGWHGGIVDAFRADLEYKFLTGGQFIAHPDGFVLHQIEPVSAHPIVAGIEPFTLRTEQYYVHADPANEVLATTTFGDHPAYPWIKGVTMPAVWTRQWGDGRVFVCTMGHSLDDLDTPQVRAIVERGLLWASRVGARG